MTRTALLPIPKLADPPAAPADAEPRLAPAPAAAEILVCTTCRAGEAAGTDGPRDGAVLLGRLQAGTLPEGVSLQGVECLSNCSRGCTLALRGAGRWTYVYGGLKPGDEAVVLEGAARYRDAADGLVPWRERPVHFRKNCIARVPPAPQARAEATRENADG